MPSCRRSWPLGRLFRSWSAGVVSLAAPALPAQTCHLLCNSDFELQQLPLASYDTVPQTLFDCWRTTAPDGLIEIWSSGFLNVEAYSGNMFVELNANAPSALFQDLRVPLGSLVTLSFAHRARHNVDVMSVEIGQDDVFTFIDPAVADGETWGLHTYQFNLPTTGSNAFTLRFAAVSTGSGDMTMGNFLDAITIEVEALRPELSLHSDPSCPGTNNGAIIATVFGGTPPFHFQWSHDGASIPVAAGLPPGAFTCTVVDTNGCVDLAVVLVEAAPEPQANVWATPVRCHGESNGTLSVEMIAGTAPFHFDWTGPADTSSTLTDLFPGTYTCTIVDVHGCKTAVSGTVEEPTAMEVKGLDRVHCAGTTTTLSAEANGGTPGYTYAWWPSGPVVAPTTDTVFFVTAEDALGCSSYADSVLVMVRSVPMVVPMVDRQAGCVPLCVQLAADVPADLQAWWHVDGLQLEDPSPLYCMEQAGQYAVGLLLRDLDGCTSWSPLSGGLTAWPLPTATFTTDPAEVTFGTSPVHFLYTGQGASQWRWTFPDGTTTDGPVASSELLTPACQEVALSVIDQHGCADHHTELICPRPDLYIPSAFSPNGDGVNDVFRVVNGERYANGFELLVFDRWGRLVHRLTHAADGWDGGDLPDGTYAWRLRYRSPGGTAVDRMGHVDLLR